MPTLICKSCGSTTNSVCSKTFILRRKMVADKCYAAFKNDKWVKGCDFDNATDFNKAYAMSLITGKNIMKFLRRKNNDN